MKRRIVQLACTRERELRWKLGTRHSVRVPEHARESHPGGPALVKKGQVVE